MTKLSFRTLALIAAFAAGTTLAASSATKAPAKPADSHSLQSVLMAWQGKAITLNWYDKDDKKSRRVLLDVGADYLKLDSDEFDATYIPMSRVARIDVKGEKLILVLNTAG